MGLTINNKAMLAGSSLDSPAAPPSGTLGGMPWLSDKCNRLVLGPPFMPEDGVSIRGPCDPMNDVDFEQKIYFILSMRRLG